MNGLEHARQKGKNYDQVCKLWKIELADAEMLVSDSVADEVSREDVMLAQANRIRAAFDDLKKATAMNFDDDTSKELADASSKYHQIRKRLADLVRADVKPKVSDITNTYSQIMPSHLKKLSCPTWHGDVTPCYRRFRNNFSQLVESHMY